MALGVRYGDGDFRTTLSDDDNMRNDDKGTDGDDGTDSDERVPGRDGDEKNCDTTMELPKRIASKLL